MPREPGWWYRPPGLAAWALQPLALAYGQIAARRIARARPYRARLPVICVGNFTAGGSGKTPFTALLAERLMARGERPVILTRGYGGTIQGPHRVDGRKDTAAQVGDEPLLLARVAPVMVSVDRRAGAIAIEAEGSATVIVMDDGLQNPSLVKDLSFAIIDGARMLGNGYVIPAGPLRLPLAVQARLVDAIVYNGATGAGGGAAGGERERWGAVGGENQQFEAELRGLCGSRSRRGSACDVPALHATLQPYGTALGGTRVVAYAGIGTPARFFDTVTTLGATLVAKVAFPDHAPYTDRDAERLLACARTHDARLVTTQKDHVRLTGTRPLEALAAASTVVPVRMVLDGPSAERLEALLREAVP